MAETDQQCAVTSRIVGLVKAHDVELTRSAAGVVITEGDMSIVNGGCGPVLSNGNVTVRNGGCGPVIARGNASIEKGGTQAIIAAGGVTIGRHGFVGVVASPKVTVEEGGRVLLGSPMAIAVGVVAGVGVALLARLMRGEPDPRSERRFGSTRRGTRDRRRRR